MAMPFRLPDHSRPWELPPLVDIWAVYVSQQRHRPDLAAWRTSREPLPLRQQPPAIRDELWNLRDLREVHELWYARGGAALVLWQAWATSLHRYSVTAPPAPGLRVALQGQVQFWKEEVHIRRRALRRVRAAGNDMFLRCHPSETHPVCPRAG